MKLFIYLFFLAYLIIGVNQLESKELSISKDFNVFTSKNAKGYLKPLITTIEESFNTGLYTGANYKNGWSISLDLGITGMFIPNSQKSFDAELPDQFGNTNFTETGELIGGNIFQNRSGTVKEPTLYGGISNPVFSAPQNNAYPDTMYKTIGFMEGNNINLMSGIPVVQLSFGIPTRTQFKTKFITLNLDGERLTFYTIGINQNIDKLFGIFDDDDSKAIALNFALHKFEYNGITMNSWSLGSHFSNTFDFGLTIYGGLQYEAFNGKLKVNRENDTTATITKSAYKEIRDRAPIAFDLESFNSFRALLGLSYRLSIFEFHGDIAYAAQPVINAGVSLWFLDQEYKEAAYEEEIPTMETPKTLIFKKELEYDRLKDYRADNLRPLPEPKPEPIITASVNFVGLNENVEVNTDKIVIEEFLSRQMRPLLPYIFFDEGADTIPSKYIQYNSNSIAEFTDDKLLGKNNLETYYQTLNIIGKRLLSNPNANITIAGYIAGKGIEKNKINIAKNRANVVKDYFVNVWGISSDRITTKSAKKPPIASNEATEQGLQENRRVEISCSDATLLSPLDINDTLRTVNPAAIRFKPSITSEKALIAWALSTKLNKDNANFKTFSGTNTPDANINLPIEEHVNLLRRNSKLEYSLSITNNDKKSFTTAEKDIPIEIVTVARKKEEAKADTIKNVYNLILFDFNKSKLGTLNKRITDVIKAEIPENAIVNIVGYTDMMGDDKHNMKLSEERAASTSVAINAGSMNYRGVGENELLFNNDLPEGRFLCRTVVVEVKIPVTNK